MFQAVIFDMDGVITDSEGIGLRVMQQAARRQGVELSDRTLHESQGMTVPAFCALYQSLNPSLDGELLNRDFEHDMLSAARKGEIPLKPGVCELLDTLDELHIPRAVASSSERIVVETYLRSNKIIQRFDALITGELAEHSKPAPDLFLLAAQTLNADPRSCLVLEDSDNGLRAGRAAGMNVCMIPDQIPYSETLAPFCDHVLPSLLDVRELILHA
ncbi:MAG: HAD family phosphatase [Clostridia bacterium]|nr:HAD family phosphatase [Clostridia bacterium]